MADAKLPLVYRAKIARSHGLWVIGALAQAYFGGLIRLGEFDQHVKDMRACFEKAETDEQQYEILLFQTAKIEEILADKSA